VDGLEARDGELWPRFDVDVLVATLEAASGRSYWRDWSRIGSLTLVVRAGKGMLSANEADAMVAALPAARLVEIQEAGHDVPLDRPEEWCGALLSFLRELGAAEPHANGAGGSVGARNDRLDAVAPGVVDGLVVLTNEAAD
jgi:pimeloyl-ACP methyl ester carboxylesterase